MVENGQQLFEQLSLSAKNKNRIDLLLLNSQMEEMKSSEFFQKLYETKNKPECILLLSLLGASELTLHEGVLLKITNTIYIPTDYFQIIHTLNSFFAANTPKVTSKNPAHKTLNILFVDDNSSIRQMGKSTLQKAGHTVTTAAGGEESLDALEENGPFDLLLLDLFMPEMNGFQVSQVIRSGRLVGVNTDIPIVCMSTQDSHIQQRKQIMEIGMTDLLEKPLEETVLLAVVEKYANTSMESNKRRDTHL